LEIEPGDRVRVVVEVPVKPPAFPLPSDLARALQEAALEEAFAARERACDRRETSEGAYGRMPRLSRKRSSSARASKAEVSSCSGHCLQQSARDFTRNACFRHAVHVQ